MNRIKVFQIYGPNAVSKKTAPELIETAVNSWLAELDGKIKIINTNLVNLPHTSYAWVMVTYELVETLKESKKEVEKPKTKSEPPQPIVLPKVDSPINPNRYWRENHPDLDGWG